MPFTSFDLQPALLPIGRGQAASADPMHLLYFAVTSGVASLIQAPLARRLGRPASSNYNGSRRLAGMVLDRALPLDGTTTERE